MKFICLVSLIALFVKYVATFLDENDVLDIDSDFVKFIANSAWYISIIIYIGIQLFTK